MRKRRSRPSRWWQRAAVAFLGESPRCPTRTRSLSGAAPQEVPTANFYLNFTAFSSPCGRLA